MPDEEPDPRFNLKAIGWGAAHFVPFVFLYASVHLPTICYRQGQRVGATDGTAPSRFTSLPVILPLIAAPATVIAWWSGVFSPGREYAAHVGDCYSVGGSNSIVVSCSEPHDGEAIEVLKMPGGDFPTGEQMDAFAAEHCPRSADWFVYPNEFAWNDGDRNFVCLERTY